MKKPALKLLSLIVVLCCLLLSFPVAATEAETPSISLFSVSGYRGDELSVYVSISDNPGIAYLKLQIDYDPALSIVNAENSGNLLGTFTASETTSAKPYVLQWLSAEDSLNNGVIATVTFKISEDASYGEKPISVAVAECYNSAFEDVDFSVYNGTVTVFPTDVPNDVMSEKVSFSDSSYQFVTFGNNQYTINFNSTKRLNNTKIIELDVYTGEGLDSLGIAIADNFGVSRSYTFTELNSGWNHLAVRIADLVQNGTNGDFTDLSNVAQFILSGSVGSEITIANVYAADYVEGDANRDGVFDLKDVVRAKKIASGVTTAGNKLAVSGNDYEINATDITSLIQRVIDSLFTSGSGDTGGTSSNPHEMPKIKF